MSKRFDDRITRWLRFEEEGESTMDKIQVGKIEAILKDGSTDFYWIVVPEGMTAKQAAETQEWHGPFKTDAEMLFEDQERTLFPDCKVVDGGMWNPAKLQ